MLVTWKLRELAVIALVTGLLVGVGVWIVLARDRDGPKGGSSEMAPEAGRIHVEGDYKLNLSGEVIIHKMGADSVLTTYRCLGSRDPGYGVDTWVKVSGVYVRDETIGSRIGTVAKVIFLRDCRFSRH